jgi:nicotinate-nucleotide pyrophosphorylase (carboxylating)
MTLLQRAPALPILLPVVYEDLIRAALREDLGDAGDITTAAIVGADMRATAALVARGDGCVAGLDAALFAFRVLDPRVEVAVSRGDGRRVGPGSVIATLRGAARAMLAAERTALNLLSHLSGIATLTAAYVRAVEAYRATIVDTRKTAPGLRALEKYAVRTGGGANHRFGLYDAVLIKDNHVAVAGGAGPAVRAARAGTGHIVKIEVEVDNLAQLEEALDAGADIVLLDNMALDDMRTAVGAAAGRALLEASGSVSLERIGDVAATGVDFISVGRLTHSAPALDIGLDFVASP